MPKLKRRLRRSFSTKLRSLYLAVQPVGSKFAKALQTCIKEKVLNNVWRVSHVVGTRQEQRGRSVFRITSEPLNKIQQFNAFKTANVAHPPFTTDAGRVGELGSKTIFARTLINSTNGRGIVEFDIQAGVPTPPAPLYTAYVNKKAEYRVHVFDGQVVDLQQKKKRRGFDGDRDTRIRNLKNGYVYVRDGVAGPPGINDLAVAAVRAVGYRYGAVDVIHNEKKDKLYVLEVNSRPGLMGTTLEKYGEALVNTFQLKRRA